MSARPTIKTVRTGEPLHLNTDRLLLREVHFGDLQDVHEMFASNPDFLQLRDEIGSYDLESVTQYWDVAAFDPGRHLLLVVHKNTGIAIGLLDFVDQSPADGKPWIGLAMIHRHHQRRGFGTEAVHALIDLFASRGYRSVRMAVIEGNELGLAFARHVGFEPSAQASAEAEGTTERVALMELLIDPQDAA